MIAAAAVLLLGGCRADVRVGVDVVPDGSGEVTVVAGLDERIGEELPDLADALETDDLVAAGWVVADPVVDGEGRTTLRATKPFADLEGAERVLDEVAGRDGPFGGLELDAAPGRASTTYELEGAVDLSEGLEAFGGPQLRELLGGSSLVLDPAELEERAGAPLAEAVRIELVADLPGEVVEGDPRVPVVLGEVADVGVRSRLAHLGWAVAAGIAGVAALGLVVVVARRLRHRAAAR